MVTVRFCHALSGCRDVVEVAFRSEGQDDVLGREVREVLLRHVPRQVRPIDADCEKERIVLVSL